MKLLLLAAKPIGHNTRVPWVASSLADRGAEVTVAAFSKPHASYRDERVRWISVPPVSSQARLLAGVARLERQIPGFAALSRGVARSVCRDRLGSLSDPRGLALLAGCAGSEVWRAANRARLGEAARQDFFNRLTGHGALNEHYDVLICHDRFPAPFIAERVSRTGEGVILDLVELIDARTDPDLHRHQSPVLAEEVEAVHALASEGAGRITVGDALGAQLDAQLGGRPSLVVHNARLARERVKARPPSADGQVHLVLSGSLFANCGPERAIALMEYLPEPFTLSLIGAAPDPLYDAVINGVLAASPARARITREATTPPDEISQRLAHFDLALMPFDPAVANLKVSMPNRIFDALAAGTPLLVQSGLDCASWLENSGAGLDGDFFDPKGLAEQLVALAEGGCLEALKASTARAADAISWEAEIAKLGQLA